MDQKVAPRAHRGTRIANRLTELKAKRLTKPGRHADGASLYLDIGPTGNKHWCFVFTRDGKRRELGLGAYPAVTITAARGKAEECRAALREGKDPFAARKAAKAFATAPTLGDCIIQYTGLQTHWSISTKRQWRPSRLSTPALLAKSIADISKSDVVEALRIRTPTMRPRVLKRLERIFDWAIERGFRTEANPAARFRLSDYFEQTKRKTKHHPPMPWPVLPEFLRGLRTKEDLPAWCLELQILTCVRPGEARGARWEEINFESAIWTVPAHRMKMGYEHRVPLSAPALRLLRRLYETRTSPLVFPSKVGGLMSADAVANRIEKDRWLNEVNENPHVHGFRGSFTNWSADHDLSFEVTEKCLAHGDPNATVRAYRQTDLLDRRRTMLEEWGTFLDGEVGA